MSIDTIWAVDATEFGEEVAAFMVEDQAKAYAEARGLMYYDIELCDEKSGARMVADAQRDE